MHSVGRYRPNLLSATSPNVLLLFFRQLSSACFMDVDQNLECHRSHFGSTGKWLGYNPSSRIDQLYQLFQLSDQRQGTVQQM
uniref:Putative secreted protein n=1 Tax=Anopheles darlingi TaxID=43151 RepID=A0A2M4DDU9_ANODA